MKKSPEQFSVEEKPEESIWHKRLRKTKEALERIRLLEKEGDIKRARKERYEFLAKLIKIQGVEPGDIIEVTFLSEEAFNLGGEEDKDERSEWGGERSEWGGEFVELTQDDIVIHCPGDDLDTSIPLETIVDIYCMVPSGKSEFDKLENL